ncbi:MAG: hypothetical protein AB9856_08925 [Cellulosilyticaceae bacterium]
MTKIRVDTKANNRICEEKYQEKIKLDTMRKGYKEMADINLSISKLCFEVEREVETYYDRIAECE